MLAFLHKDNQLSQISGYMAGSEETFRYHILRRMDCYLSPPKTHENENLNKETQY